MSVVVAKLNDVNSKSYGPKRRKSSMRLMVALTIVDHKATYKVLTSDHSHSCFLQNGQETAPETLKKTKSTKKAHPKAPRKSDGNTQSTRKHQKAT
jgi:hypothetical protein